MIVPFTIFIYGLILGSFYNVVGVRVPIGKSIVFPPSTCSQCGSRLAAIDLIPIVSYILVKGRCRKCSKEISPLYLIIELLTPLLFLYSYYIFGWTISFLSAVLLISLFSILIVSDVIYMLIPNRILLVFFLFFFLVRLVDPLETWWNSLTAAAIGFSLLLSIAVISKGGMGGGDIKLFALLGFVLGSKLVLLSFFLSCFLVAVISLILLYFGIIKKGKPIPFAPFVSLGTLITYFQGEVLVDWYLSLF